jgi:hypothetical protein
MALVLILLFVGPTLACLPVALFITKRDATTLESSLPIVAWALLPYVVGVGAYYVVTVSDPVETVLVLISAAMLNLVVGSSVLLLASRLRRSPSGASPPRPDINRERSSKG